ncbi:MAG: hypothetical protein A3G25_19850 [Betaproteobacteria bacterium RIFCSPLOWO2_12_FULL_63_13]|nr:MAG: hypothetical protein A3G25_19850 [Betaproteobacteria bacterium RIFCSPLOWO2_12_FULL_63_13]
MEFFQWARATATKRRVRMRTCVSLKRKMDRGGFRLMFAGLGLAMVLAFLTRETYCRPLA